ncbi:fluoride efflux transporter CrcB [Myxococcota bacterium]|nr:fluoride efflux transporter CrcB [Myxococcota bacterium]
MRTALSIAVLGALGALARHYTGAFLKAHVDTPLPAGTIGVNVLGSFLLGVLTALALSQRVSEELRAPLAIGFLGSFTTFSTFSLEVVQLAQAGRLDLAALNLGLQLGAGFLALAGGLALGRALGA